MTSPTKPFLRGFISSAVLTALAAFASPVSAQTIVDFNRSDGTASLANQTETGYSGLAIDGSAGSNSQPSQFTLSASFGNGNFTGGNVGEYSISVEEVELGFVKSPPSAGIESRSRSGNAPSLPDLLRDYWKTDNDVSNAIDFTLEGLQAGVYDITTYHTGVRFYDGATHEVEVLDANNATFSSIGSTTQTGEFDGGGSGPSNVSSLSYSFESDGTNPVVLRITTSTSHDPLINGYDLALIPEPRFYGLAGGVLAFGLVLLRRRKTRR